MFNNRLIVSVATLALLIVAAGVVKVAGGDVSDYFQRHPEAVIPLTGETGSDYFQRHPELSRSNSPEDMSDYFQRHASTTVTNGAVASDWFERHPESLRANNPVDLSDYFQRHSDSIKADNTVQRSDARSSTRLTVSATLKDAQLEKSDTMRTGNASVTFTGETDSYQELQKEQRAAMKSVPSTVYRTVVPVHPRNYVEFKASQLEDLEARLIEGVDFAEPTIYDLCTIIYPNLCQ